MELSRLSAFPLFDGLSEEDLAPIAAAASEVDAAEGEALATEGDFGYALYAIESGTADVTADGEHLRSLGPGDVFGEIAIISSGRRTASVTATSPMRLIAFFKRDVWALEKRSPEAVGRLRELIADRRGG
jgi:CRP-like cAMP-binding protein